MPPKNPKKYVLLKTTGDLKPPCAFFARGECRNGDTCKFSHTTTPTDLKPSRHQQSDSSSVVSSESEDEEPSPKQPPVINIGRIVKVEAKKKEKATKPSEPPRPSEPPTSDSDEETEAQLLEIQRKLQEKKKKKEEEEAKAKAAKAEKKQPQEKKRKKEAEGAAQKKQKKKTPEAQVSTPTSSLSSLFSSSMFPVSSFSTEPPKPSKPSTPPTPNTPSSPSPISGQSTSPKATSPKKSPQPPIPPPPLPSSPVTKTSKSWHPLVLQTRSHPRFAGCLSGLKSPSTDPTWFKSTPYTSLEKTDKRHSTGPMPKIIAMDCEMVETRDPLTGKIDSKSLSRLSVIDGENPSNVLIDTLVKPYWPVTDYRTRINGISEESLKGCNFTLRHAQKFMDEVCSDETVIAGHAIHNDLISLRMEHYRVVDSSFLFKATENSTAPPSLKDCVKHILGLEMPKTHDSVNDAAQSMALLQNYKENSGQTSEIIRSSKNTHTDTNGPDTLFVHHIPPGCDVEKVKKMFLNHTEVVPKKLGELQTPSDGGFSKIVVYFSTKDEASKCFEGFRGQAKLDKGGREQKQVFMRKKVGEKSAEHVFVRKNGPTKRKE
ncbi:hypothetical protein TrST_g12173 [Triparma strigata]|uniref:C3H1-type domain-containing protein n=1 Tax=Triparma strigata TaxID=1606541 RepID=A0A9W7EIR4_9STRA|nr:hypothetical protein TrST_g12173 [Triparma strigata]